MGIVMNKCDYTCECHTVLYFFRVAWRKMSGIFSKAPLQSKGVVGGVVGEATSTIADKFLCIVNIGLSVVGLGYLLLLSLFVYSYSGQQIHL
jgi:hypothetical protein